MSETEKWRCPQCGQSNTRGKWISRVESTSAPTVYSAFQHECGYTTVPISLSEFVWGDYFPNRRHKIRKIAVARGSTPLVNSAEVG